MDRQKKTHLLIKSQVKATLQRTRRENPNSEEVLKIAVTDRISKASVNAVLPKEHICFNVPTGAKQITNVLQKK